MSFGGMNGVNPLTGRAMDSKPAPQPISATNPPPGLQANPWFGTGFSNVPNNGVNPATGLPYTDAQLQYFGVMPGSPAYNTIYAGTTTNPLAMPVLRPQTFAGTSTMPTQFRPGATTQLLSAKAPVAPVRTGK